MIRLLVRAWHDPVGSKVISTVILAALAAVGAAIYWQGLLALPGQIVDFLLRRSLVPNWMTILLSAFTLFFFAGVALVIAAIWQREKQPSPFEYQTDVILGIRWRWTYLRGGNISRLVPYCPKCDMQIVLREAGAYRGLGMVSLACDACREVSVTFEESSDDLLYRVMRLIQQTLRTGDWKTRVAADPQP